LHWAGYETADHSSSSIWTVREREREKRERKREGENDSFDHFSKLSQQEAPFILGFLSKDSLFTVQIMTGRLFTDCAAVAVKREREREIVPPIGKVKDCQ
jgi:hypothetical protein